MIDEVQDSGRLPRDGIANTLLIAIGVSLVCSVLVTAAVMLLRPLQLENEFFFKNRVGVLQAAGLYERGADLNKSFEVIDQRIVDLATGEYTDVVPVDGFDPVAAAIDPELNVAIPEDQDEADLKRRAKYALVSLVRSDDGVDQIILPVYGAGMWSTIRGYLAVSPDGQTVRGLYFYEHGETPGIGDLIEDPDWLAKWDGVKIYDDEGEAKLGVARRRVRAPFEVDAISGATRTTRGVTNMLRYWMGPHGFGPYIQRIQNEESVDG